MEELLEGGNLSVEVDGEVFTADKVDFFKHERKEIKEITFDILNKLNRIHSEKFGNLLFKDIKQLFNGSSDFIFSNDYDDDTIKRYKPTMGDVDVVIPREYAENVFKILNSGFKGDNWVFIKSNRTSVEALGNQINSLFKYKLKSGTINLQIDFEITDFEDGNPTKWTKFSHSSSLEDLLLGIKGLHHKYILRALIGSVSERDDIVIATKNSTPQKIRIKKIEELPRMLKFSVDLGVREAYAPMLDNGVQVMYQGKKVFKEIDTKDSNYIKDVDVISNMIFKKNVDIGSFKSIIDSLKLLDSKVIEKVFERYTNLLWGKGAQQLDASSAKVDYDVKMTAWEYFRKKLGIKEPNGFKEFLESYYENYVER